MIIYNARKREAATDCSLPYENMHVHRARLHHWGGGRCTTSRGGGGGGGRAAGEGILTSYNKRSVCELTTEKESVDSVSLMVTWQGLHSIGKA